MESEKEKVFCQNTHRFVHRARQTEPPLRAQVVDSYNIEFGYELISALPYAYYLHQRGLLIESISGVDTSCLYFFSPKHRENNALRSWDNMKKAKSIPNIKIHRPVLDKYFSPPPLKEKYKNDRFVFDKPTLCICNRVNSEWGKGAINYFDAACLKKMFEALSSDYRIIYFNIRGKKEYYDGPEQMNIGDYELAADMGVSTIHDLHSQNPDLTFNELQLMVMANSERFITMNGGYAILASYMGGTNIIYSKECHELKTSVNSFYMWYNRFGGSRIVHIDNYGDLHSQVDTHFVKKVPTVNVIMRTCQRPRYFRSAYQSVADQTYPNVNLVVGYHDTETESYLTPYRIYPVKYLPYTESMPPKNDKSRYGRPFPSNHYLNILFKEAKDGWIFWLDDDDAFVSKNAVAQIMSQAKTDDDLLLWRMNNNGRIIPKDENFGNQPVAGDISAIAFAVHTKHIRDYFMEPYKLGDYRLINHLYNKLNPVWIDKVLTKIQGEAQGGGYRKDKPV